VRGAICLRETGNGETVWFFGATVLIAGVLLIAGFMTPIVAFVLALGAAAAALSLLPGCPATLFTADVPVLLGITRLLAIALLGPGAISVDARLYGRREIIIPPPAAR